MTPRETRMKKRSMWGDVYGVLTLTAPCVALLAACGSSPAATPPPQGVATSGHPATTTAGSTVTTMPTAGSTTTPPPNNTGSAGKAPTAGSTTPTTTAGTTSTGTSGTGSTATAGTSSTTAGTGSTTTGGTGSGSAGTGGSVMPGGACLDGITDYEMDGPFKFMATAKGMVKVWVPMVPAGCKVPVIHLANGTGATCSAYQPALERMASHGFLTTCYEDPNTGAGTQGVMAFDTALKEYPDLADHRLGSTGHSQGGQAAFTVLALAEMKFGADYIYAGLAMEPASGFGTQPAGGTWQSLYAKIKSPMFMFSGTADMLVPEAWVQQAFDALDKGIEAYWWSAVGATHIPVPNAPEQQVSIPWFRWKLLGDQKACAFFKKMPDGMDWDERMKQNDKPCM
jgi:fermentation-respiration switch protein FrsA (DUF1100 family)